MLQFESEQLGNLILKLEHEQFSGIASVETSSNVSTIKHPRILVFFNGELTYCGLSRPDPIELSQKLGQHFQLDIKEAAIQLAQKRVDDPTQLIWPRETTAMDLPGNSSGVIFFSGNRPGLT